MSKKAWLGAVVLFFVWGFVMHTTGLLLHEFGGHALASRIFGCGIDGYKLTFFGHGQVHYAPCTRWTSSTILVADWAGLALTAGAGLVAAVVVRRPRLSPMARLLVALVAFFFLLGQLGYATSGGFHDLYDPGRTARRLGARGLHVLAWLPALVAYAAASFFGARAAVDAFREHFGTRTRLHGLRQLASTLGVAGVLYFAAFRIEWQLRRDMEMRGVAAEAERIAVARHGPKPFPIEHVLLAVAVVAVIYALARPVNAAAQASAPSRRLRTVVATSAAICFVTLALLIARA
ncbi:MAG: hypothetical protein KF819_18110 [Labilithrix sp.]|nr:hypothetical protein [Labilithrix sp.]